MALKYTLFDFANLTAKHLFDIGAVKFQPDDPFTFTSGRLSPIYVDVRLVTGVPAVRASIARMAFSKIVADIGVNAFDYIIGGETAGVPMAALVADRAHCEMGYVRKQPKGFGRCAQIEGLTDEQLSQNKRILLFEDLCSDGGSKMNFIQAIRRSGNTVTDVFVICSYGCFGAAAALRAEGIKLHAMTTAENLVEVAADLGYFPAGTIDQVREFLAAPDIYDSMHRKPEPVAPEPEAVTS